MSVTVTAEQIREEAEARITEERTEYSRANTAKPVTEPSWPDPLAPEAFHGLAGDFVHIIEPHTEADPAAVLLQFLVAFGNAIGDGPHFVVEADRHRTNLYLVLVGETAKGRKGTSWGHVKRAFSVIDEPWGEGRIKEGLSSGEGLIWAVRDAITKREPIRQAKEIIGYQDVETDPGVADKRLLVVESEFASVLRTMNREGNILSAIVRRAWDSGNLQVLTKNSPAAASRSHISIIGHVTREDLRRDLSRTDAANGFGNRFLWACVRRSKALPEGGNLQESDLASCLESLGRAVVFASQTERIVWTPEALEVWRAVYPELSEGKPGLLGAVTSRAEAQTVRLASVYALLDQSKQINREHLLAALAVWDFVEASARYIFGDATGDPTADRILEGLKANPEGGLSRTEIRDLFSRHKGDDEIGRALTMLQNCGRIVCEKVSTGGRPSERWRLRTNGAA